MTVTKIEAVVNSKNRYKVYVDEQFAFVLYKGELSRYNIMLGEKLTDEIYNEIHDEVIVKRAKLRALHLLNTMGRTEHQLRHKLKQCDFKEDVIDKAITYVKSFGYVNDSEYARSYIMNRKDKKSKKELYIQLVQKGIEAEVLEAVFEESYDNDSSKEAIYKLLAKKKYDPDNTTKEETRKIIAFLTRKGFGYEDIRQVLQVSEWNA